MDTVLGGGPSSTPGRWVFNAINALNAGVYWLSGLGLSNDENDLYLTLMSINTVGVVRNVNSPGISQFVYICGISVFNTRSNIPQGAGIYSCGSALNDNSARSVALSIARAALAPLSRADLVSRAAFRPTRTRAP